MKFKIGDSVVTKNNKYWSGKSGTIERTVEYEFYTVYMVRLDVSDLCMGFKIDELRKL